MKNNTLIFKFLCASWKYHPHFGKTNRSICGPKKGPECSSYSECHNSGLQCIGRTVWGNLHNICLQHAWFKPALLLSWTLMLMQANWFSWVPIQICLKQQKTHNLKDICFVFTKYFYHGCDLFSFNLFLVFWSHSCEPSSSESSLWRQRDYSGRGTDVVKNPCSLLWTFLVVYSHYVSGVGNMWRHASFWMFTP